MERTQRIVDRLPAFYRAWDDDSVLFKVIDSVGRSLETPHLDLSLVIKSHWVDTAYRSDLDGLGAIFDLPRSPKESDDDYRLRIKSVVQGFKGGGTRDAILTLVGLFVGLRGAESLELDENPPAALSTTRSVSSGQAWELGSMGVNDATPSIDIEVGGDGLRIVDPKLSNLDSGEVLQYTGELKSGQKLSVTATGSQLDGKPLPGDAAPKTVPRMLRAGSHWEFEEALSAKVGRFDRSSFDQSVFEIPLPPTNVTFTWTANQVDAFELKVPPSALERNILTVGDVESFVNIIKGAGVKATVSVK